MPAATIPAVVAEALTLTGLAVVLITAAVALLVVRRLRQPMVLGYLVAGLLVGPFGPSPVRPLEAGSVETLASLGIIFIMVSLGLEFNPRKLRQIGAAPVGAAIVQMLVSFVGARIAAEALGFPPEASLYMAVALSISSTIVAVKILEEKGELGSSPGRLAVGILLVQDIAAIVFLAVLGSRSVTGTLAFGAVTPTLVGILIFTLAALVVGALFVPRLLSEAARGSQELLLIVILGLVFAVSLLADHFGFSIALGAFITGAIIAETRVVQDAERLVEPLKHMFTAVFFVSIGMLIDPALILDHWLAVAVLSAVVIVTRLVGTSIPAFLFGHPPRAALRSGASISQIGEFTFIVVAPVIALGLLDAEVLAVFVGVAGITTLLTPYVMGASGPLLRVAGRLTPAPLRTYADLYGGWVQRLGEAEETRRHRSKEGALVRRIALNVVALLVIGALAFLMGRVLAGMEIRLGDLRFPAIYAVWPLLAIVGIPFLLTIWTSLRELAVEVVLELVPDRVAQQDEPPIALKVVRASLGLVSALAVGAIVIALLPTQGQTSVLVVGLVVAVVALAGVLLWRRIKSMHAHVEGTIEGLFGAPRTKEERDEVMRLIGRHYAVSLGTEAVVLPDGSPVAHHQIRDAQVRNRTGATIVSIDRGDERFVNPPPNLLLLPGDRILLMGEQHHLEKARRLLAPPLADDGGAPPVSARGEAEVREVLLSHASIGAGRSIAELALRTATGASLVAVIRDHDHIQNPTPNFALQGGDRLFLLGTARQLDDAERFLGQKRKPPREPEAPREDPGAGATPAA